MQPLAALYPTVRLSPWRQVRKNIHSRVWTPPDLYSTQEDHASWFPLVPSDWGIWASPPETDQDSCPGWLPPVPLDLVSPQEGSSPGPLTLILWFVVRCLIRWATGPSVTMDSIFNCKKLIFDFDIISVVYILDFSRITCHAITVVTNTE